ncbi:hypothetical protein F5888DRAFT_1267570 [Russula emetica]|nr:hypothetical protein F5888DRAFT_1267570 [Russula emetica]
MPRLTPAGYTFPPFNTLAVQNHLRSPRMHRAHSTLLRCSKPSQRGPGCELCAAECLALPTPRDVFLTALAKAALPPHFVAALDETQQASSVLRSPVSFEGLTLGLTAGGGGGAPGLHGAEINAFDHRGESPIHTALRFQKIDVVELLLKNGADANVPERSERWPRMLTSFLPNNSVPGENMPGTSCVKLSALSNMCNLDIIMRQMVPVIPGWWQR